jgi:4-amino-4-deoxy-L-arabinose transferase-like glycosyltransferase
MHKLITLILIWIKKNKIFLTLVLFYFLLRLINLTKLPIFNDEAIYLDWGFRETHTSGNLYYSLYDSKQPFLMWVFGILQSFIDDPLFAGRIVSVFTGLFTLIGIYKLSKLVFAKNIALLAIFLYSIVPIFSFYDRQALMESSIATIGVWSCFFMLRSFKDKSLKYVIFLGFILGLGFFIKSSAFIFLISYIVVVFVNVFLSKKIQPLADLFYVVLVFLVSISLLLINPQFWDTLGSNSRYTLTVNELLTFPLSKWLQSVLANIQIGVFGITPLLFITAVIGIFMGLVKKNLLRNYFLLFFLSSCLIVSLTVRLATDRYLISFLPFLTITASYLIYLVIIKHIKIGILFLGIILILPCYLTALQVTNPSDYLLLTEKFTYFTNGSYLRGVTSGYGINETVAYFNKLSRLSKIEVTIAENTGNPESAMIVYFNKSKKVQVVYMDSRLFNAGLSTTYNCFSSKLPLYFVARDDQLAGLDKYLEKITSIRNPYGPNSMGIYTLRKNCKGKTLELNPVTT